MSEGIIKMLTIYHYHYSSELAINWAWTRSWRFRLDVEAFLLQLKNQFLKL